jgi:hypothetical protein
MFEPLPDRASNSGPEPSWPADWRDWLCIAEEDIAAARRMESDIQFDSNAKRNRVRIAAINAAMDALIAAKELLCKELPCK